MAITWRNVGAPNVGGGASEFAAGTNLISSGLDRLSDVAGGFQEREKKNSRAELHNELLDLAMNPELNEKAFMRDAIKLGRESGLSPEQSLAQVEQVRNIYNQAGALTEEQQREVSTLQAEEEALRLNREANNQAALAAFDQRYPQAKRLNEEFSSFQSTGGLGAVLQGVAGNIEDGGDREETLSAIRKEQESGNYEDFVVAKTVQEMGLDSPGFIFDSSLINSRKFRDRLKFNQKQYAEQSNNWLRRGQLEADLNATNAAQIRASRDALRQIQKDFEMENRAVFAGK
ncbi:hypothetical protein VPMG_00083 [Vibrio phage VBP32]|uniref:Uncharacterized protein n=2 Tax=Stoningtonvirus VBP47 TaxID=2846606 RepID=M4SP45_9CAUD|nr:hypothetical protein VPNG_00046 [Vibrio phage VBP47]YP_007676573.1 hypothetical protein VPMG_00083 [Vibrio phage VBP32]AGH57070.1 hypothetical protein VPNG_00046 [Vibrio phage VBP47]AGH57222.1 hypothetical protein VPMG_00083 [Vibrio phage VBP32]